MLLINNPNINTPNFCALVPLKDYKGPILKLTEEEQQQINALREQIVRMEITEFKQDCIHGSKKHLSTETGNKYHGYKKKFSDLREELLRQIREIKINRHNIQAKEAESQN